MLQRFLEPVNRLVNLGSSLQELEGNLSRLDDVLHNPIDSQLEEDAEVKERESRREKEQKTRRKILDQHSVTASSFRFQSLEQLQVTRVVIAHRLSTIRNADRIYVLQNGRVVQQGRFEQLANQAGLFAQLMTRQML